MNIHSYDKLVIERLEDDRVLAINKGVATAIKRKRREKNYTQEQVSKGICSISYLSKIENGYLEVDNYYVQEIINRIGIDIKEINDKDYSSDIKNLIKAINLEEDKLVIDIFNKINLENPKNCLRAELIFLGKHLYFKEFNESINLIKAIGLVKKDLDNYELKVFLYFISLYEAEHMRNMSAISYINVLSKLESDDQHLNSLIEFLKIRVYIYLGEYILALNSINSIENYVNSSMNINKTIWLKLLQIELLILSGKPDTSQEILNLIKINSLPDSTLEYYYYVNGLYLKEIELYEEAINMFLIGSNRYYYKCIFNVIECYYELGNKEMVKKYFDIFKEKDIEEHHFIYEMLINYFEIKSHDNLYELKDFISRQMLPMFKKIKYRYYQEKVLKDLINFHSMNGRYKEIYKIREKFNNDFL